MPLIVGANLLLGNSKAVAQALQLPLSPMVVWAATLVAKLPYPQLHKTPLFQKRSTISRLTPLALCPSLMGTIRYAPRGYHILWETYQPEPPAISGRPMLT